MRDGGQVTFSLLYHLASSSLSLIVVTPDQVGSGCVFLLCGLSELKSILLCRPLSILGTFGMWNLEVTLPEKRKKQFLSVIV